MRLEIKDLRVAYGKIEALKGISITVNQGEIVSLIGANGAGKSSLYWALYTFLQSEVVPESWTGRIVNPESETRSPCPRNDVSTVLI